VTAAVICALAGLIVGSLLNLLIDRIPIKDPAARVPLHRAPQCAWCDANRGIAALVPIAGALRPCPSCGEKPRRRELVVPIVTAGLFAAMSAQIHDPLVLLAYLLFSAFIIAVSAIDLEHYRIPDRIVFPMLAISVPAVIAISFAKDVPETIPRALLGSVTFFGVLLIFHLISPRGMGFGDVKLGLVLGLYTGWLALETIEAPYLAIIALFFGAIIGVVVGLVVALSRGRKAAFPFGPALCAGAALVVLFSDRIIS
jgi:leader peptidase (prepilin peptidase)/N-methyltransferase